MPSNAGRQRNTALEGTTSNEARVAFHIAGRALRFEVPSQRLADHIAALCPAYAAADVREPAEAFRVYPHANEWAVRATGQDPDTFPSLEDALVAIEYLIAVRLLSLASHVPHVHAAGAVIHDQAVLALGQSGAGKTSIALHWSQSGWPVLGDDIVTLNGEGHAAPFKRLFNVHTERLRRYQLGPEPALAWLSDAEEAWYDPRCAAGGGWAEPAPIGVIAVVVFAEGAETVLRSLSKPESLGMLLSSIMPSGLPAAECVDRCAAIATRAKGVHLTFGDAGDAADTVAALLA